MATMKGAGFGRIVAGMVIVVLQLDGAGIDLLSEPVGWLLVVLGAGACGWLDGAFRTARAWALVALVASIGAWLAPDASAEASICSLAESVADLVAWWFLCTGVAAAATERDLTSLHDTARSHRRFLLIVGTVSVAMSVLVLLGVAETIDLAIPIRIATRIAMVILRVLLIGLMLFARRELARVEPRIPLEVFD